MTPHPLHGNQAPAVDPRDSVWLSASAGTGKTQVLSARVLRLLLTEGVTPDAILCLTFTKAGATEMAARINDRLASWVRMDEGRLFLELEAIGAPSGPEALARARRLFTQVLDCPGGGLRIDTIHAFSQWLLAAFPEEADLTPRTRPMEDRERLLLARRTLAELLVDAEAAGNATLLDAVARLSLRMAPEAVEGWLLRCAAARPCWFGPGAWQPPLQPHVHRLLELPVDAGEAWLAAHCADDAFDVAALRCCHAAYAQWSAKSGKDGFAVLSDWLSASPAQRLATLDDLWKTLFTQKDTVRSETSLLKFEEGYVEAALAVQASAQKVRDARALLDLAQWLAPALELGRAFALAWEEAKAREGLIDFDDQIRRAAELLTRAGMADWIRYKLDRRFDHVLVDEAQDTNAAQWAIIRALTEEFWAGEGTHGSGTRTLFVVGDYKQAIFGFQGTSPENFETARRHFRDIMAGAVAGGRANRDGPFLRELVELGLDRSFRTGAPVLSFVDAAIAAIGPEKFGLPGAPDPHVGAHRPGQVVLWKPVGEARDEETLPEDAEPGEQSWLSGPERDLADRIARQVKLWLDSGFPLHKGEPRNADAGDVMVLVRKRGALAGLIVARLHASGVPVAGVDRLRLGAPLAVRDLVAALRFAAQPLDDLNLASLLVSPLLGWTQAQLLEHGWRPKGRRLWEHLRASADPHVAATLGLLGDLLRRADFEPVQALLHWLLVGPWEARSKLAARLGDEVHDPLDELVNAAHAYAATATPSLVGFLAWFDAGQGELKREADGAGGLVRVMTVHGSKGLQAPIVILADAAGNPESGRPPDLDLADPAASLSGVERAVPLPGLARPEKVGPIARAEAAIAKADSEEHWRLLYVAMTRAEEALFVTGALGAREKEAAPESWYARLAQVGGPGDWVDDPIWVARREHGVPPPPVPRPVPEQRPLLDDEGKPGWLLRPPPAEPRPPKPLAPSSAGEDLSPDPPAAGLSPAALAQTARRGTLVHKLLERLPVLPEAERESAAATWLARQAADLGEAARADIAASALRVIADPRWAELFGPQALAEIPIAATVGERVIAGTIDRVLVTPTAIRLVDFKSARRPPESLEQVPAALLRQMAAYALALEAAYPGRSIEAALLYTQAPRLIAIPADVLDRHKLALSTTQESLALQPLPSEPLRLD
ncbi:MAG: double-strand break repair helicase AddA [Sphingomonadales bacterium]|nr:double-strand break repair helicase AddA [Sphingomonadales bacterium]